MRPQISRSLDPVAPHFFHYQLFQNLLFLFGVRLCSFPGGEFAGQGFFSAEPPCGLTHLFKI